MGYGWGGQDQNAQALAKTLPEAYIAPMHPITFIKMHGLGNDFVIIDSRGRDAVTTPALARAIGDRNRGVGFDQLAEIRDSDSADYALEFWNADGSRAGACGNASRCVASLMLDGRDRVTFITDRGVLRAERAGDMISVNMGHPQLDWDEVPLSHAMDTAHLPIEGDPIAVGMGNPHCIFFVEDAEGVDLPGLGARMEYHDLFPQRTNVEFATLTAPDHLRMRVWERGAGITLACGSGTCATAVAAHLRGLTGRRVTVDVDGGRMEIDWRDDGVWMTAPVAHVFDGTLSTDWLEATI